MNVSCQQYTNLVWFTLWLIVVSKFVLIDWTKFQEKLDFLKEGFLKNRYLLSFIDNSFKTFVDRLFIKLPQVTTVEKKTLFLFLTYLREMSLQTRTKLRKSLIGELKFCKLHVVCF